MSKIFGDFTEEGRHTIGLMAASKICTAIYDISTFYLYYPALTGGTLYKTGSRKDLDIVFYEHLMDGVPSGDRAGLLKALIGIGFIPKEPLLLRSFKEDDLICNRFVYKFKVFHIEGAIKTKRGIQIKEGCQDSEGRIAETIDIDFLFPISVSSEGFYDECRMIGVDMQRS